MICGNAPPLCLCEITLAGGQACDGARLGSGLCSQGSSPNYGTTWYGNILILLIHVYNVLINYIALCKYRARHAFSSEWSCMTSYYSIHSPG